MAPDPEQTLIDNFSSHRFDLWSQSLFNKKPTLDMWAYQQVGTKNDGPYRDKYRQLPIKECGEELVNSSVYGLVNKDYYLNKAYDLFIRGDEAFLPLIKDRKVYPFAWIRKSVAVKLQQADALLRKHNLFLSLDSGWRHPSVQSLAAQQAKAKLGEKEVRRMFSPNHKNPVASPTPHNTGGACDVGLWSFQSQKRLAFSYPGDDYNFYTLELKPEKHLSKLDKDKKFARRLLFHVLTSTGLTIHPGEFWHFGDGDPLSAYLNKQPFAKFGYIEPPIDYQFTHMQV